MVESHALAGALHGFATPCFILGPGRNVVFLNQAGFDCLGEATGLAIIDGHLDVDDPQVSRSIDACLTMTASHEGPSGPDGCGNDGLPKKSGAMTLPAPVPEHLEFRLSDVNGSAPRLVVLTPLSDTAGEPRLAVFVLGSVSHLNLEAGIARLRRLFNMTRAEAEIAARLVRGESPRDIAKARQTSEQTVRTQIKLVLQKAGCRRQIDLMRLLPIVLSRAGQSLQVGGLSVANHQA
jgi:DNA-binding CsgD family transcriptional regulator